MPRRSLAVALAGAVVALAGCGGSEATREPSAARVVRLDSVLDLRARFNADRGRPRVLLLLSPT